MRFLNTPDALYLTLDESGAVESEEVSPGIIVDYNADNHNRPPFAIGFNLSN